MGRTLGAALTKRREVGAAEAYQPVLELADLPRPGPARAQVVPKAIAMPFGVLAVWFAVAGLFQAWRLYVRETGSETAERVEDRRKARRAEDASARVI